ncbi:glycosyltransferase [Camelliibacillus cellulosilyticus]|uniref:Glycosyltransferase n=1 Tax=Camelliibacillus cellulosilyticus TaxID=2174486 RepID=A0ABV9GKI7_9BACL
MGKKTVLILTGQYGEGHKQAAFALQKAVEQYDSAVRTVILDPAAYAHPTVEKMLRHLFIGGVKRFPTLYHYIYQKTRGNNPASALLKINNYLGLNKLLKKIDELNPAVIVSTCPVASGMISILKKNEAIDQPLVTVITDYSAHNYWVYPGTDVYLVGSAKVKKDLQRMDIADANIIPTGIPIDAKFTKAYQRDELLDKHALEKDMPTVLISGGGYGLIGKGASIISMLEAMPFKMQVMIVCGYNRKMYEQLKEEIHTSKHRILLKGYVDHIEELMAVSDLMITKAGGLTITEAMAMNIPMVLFPAIGGQEFDNTQFVLEMQAALLADDAQDLCRKTAQLMTDKELYLSLKNHAKQLQHTHAAADAAKIIMNLFPGETLSQPAELQSLWESAVH